MTATDIVNATLPLLHASSTSNLGGWSESDLYGYLNRSLAQGCADIAFLASYASVAVTAGDLTATLPGSPIALIQASWDHAVLGVRTSLEMDAFDADWRNAIGGTPDTLVVDQQGYNIVRLYPYPDANGTLRVWTRQAPSTLSSGGSQVISQIADWLVELEIVAEANRRGGKYNMPETAEAAQSTANVLKAAARLYYGGAV
jgi:hypothetical protein